MPSQMTQDATPHVDGPVAGAVIEQTSELLAVPPAIDPVDVLAAKLA
jgi:hypothetical protein